MPDRDPAESAGSDSEALDGENRLFYLLINQLMNRDEGEMNKVLITRQVEIFVIDKRFKRSYDLLLTFI